MVYRLYIYIYIIIIRVYIVYVVKRVFIYLIFPVRIQTKSNYTFFSHLFIFLG